MGVTGPLGRAIQEHRPDVANGFSGIQPFGADIDAVLNTIAPKYAERIVQLRQARLCCGVPTVCQKAVGLQQSCGANKAIGIPPKRRATRRAASAQDALIKPI